MTTHVLVEYMRCIVGGQTDHQCKCHEGRNTHTTRVYVLADGRQDHQHK